MSTTTVTKDERLALRLTARQKQRIEEAATVRGTTLTEFSVQALMSQVDEVLASRPVFEVSERQWVEFQTALSRQPEAVPGLVDLFQRPSVFE